MDKMHLPHPPSIPAEVYTREYFETSCQGYDEFKLTHGEKLPLRLSIPLKVGKIASGMYVVDLGCGRGELVINCARLGAKTWGVDYSKDALVLAREGLTDEKFSKYKNRMAIQRGNVQQLPFADESIDLIYMLDIVEHLNPEELQSAFNEAWRILRPEGRLVVHTMPNLWYYHYGYPIYRFILSLIGSRLPKNPRERWEYAHVHVNEQEPRKLRKAMEASRFRTKIWLFPAQTYENETNSILRMGMEFLSHVYPFRWIFCNDIFAIGTK